MWDPSVGDMAEKSISIFQEVSVINNVLFSSCVYMYTIQQQAKLHSDEYMGVRIASKLQGFIELHIDALSE